MEFLISICIPAYRQPRLLERCLDSLLLQDYGRLEVIITDDSPDDSVQQVVTAYHERLPIAYFRNEKALGSPGNWNASLGHAIGDLVLVLHHDDYLAAPDALRAYAACFAADPVVEAVSSKIVTMDTTGIRTEVARQGRDLQAVYKHPERIVAANLIGPPSLLMLRRASVLPYDPAYIWLVDLELYLRLLERGLRFAYIDRHLITIAIHPAQVTNTLINAPIMLREHMLIARGREERFRRDWNVYDHYWRLLRNLGVRSLDDLRQKGVGPDLVPPFVQRMLRQQGRIPARWLRFGPFSRLLMEWSFRTSG